jgi:hypothetical protein
MSADKKLIALSPDIWFKPSEVWEIRGAEYVRARDGSLI